MVHHRLAALLTPVVAWAARRWRDLHDDRGSTNTTDTILWITLTVAVALAAYAVFSSKILAKIASLDLG